MIERGHKGAQHDNYAPLACGTKDASLSCCIDSDNSTDKKNTTTRATCPRFVVGGVLGYCYYVKEY